MGVSIFNTGYDLQDQIDAAESAIAIVSIGSTHAAITSGQYVYVREHGTLAEGLYRATANIAANGTLSSSNVTAVSGGGLNALNSKTSVMSLSGSQQLKSFAFNNDVCPYPCVKWFDLRNSSPTGLPDSNAVYGMARVDRRSVGVAMITIYRDSGVADFCSSFDGGSTWTNWDSYAFNSKIIAQTHGRDTVSWGQSADIYRPANASMQIFGGRQGYPFMIYIPENTNEYATIIGTAIASVTVTMTKVTITAASSGYGSSLNYEFISFV